MSKPEYYRLCERLVHVDVVKKRKVPKKSTWVTPVVNGKVADYKLRKKIAKTTDFEATLRMVVNEHGERRMVMSVDFVEKARSIRRHDTYTDATVGEQKLQEERELQKAEATRLAAVAEEQRAIEDARAASLRKAAARRSDSPSSQKEMRRLRFG